jgi:hypothetical protein
VLSLAPVVADGWSGGDARRSTAKPSTGLQSLAYNRGMANLTLVYGLRLLPSDEVTEVGSATIKLKNGREAHVTMHTLEGSKDEIEKQLKTSLAAFFDIYPEI